MNEVAKPATQVHPTATVDGARLGDGCVIEALAFVGEGCVLEPGVYVGVRATVVCGTLDLPAATLLKSGVRVEAGAVVHGPLTIGQGAVVRAGSVVTEDVPANAIVSGHPAEVTGYTLAEDREPIVFVAPPPDPGDTVDVAGASLIRLPRVADLRGSLTVAELGDGLPFEPRRVFMVFGVANRKIRGSHAHKELHEYLIAVGGQITVVIDNGSRRSQVALDEPDLALHIPPMLWATQYDYSPSATLVVLASDEYDETDYIRDYTEYLRLLRGR